MIYYARILGEILLVLLAFKIGIIPLCKQIYKSSDDQCVGCVADELPCDHEGFPFLKTQRRVWFYFVSSAVASWAFVVWYSHTHLPNLDINTPNVGKFFLPRGYFDWV